MTQFAETTEDFSDSAENDSFLRDAVRIFCQNRMAMTGLILVGALIFVALFAPLISHHDPYRVALNEQLLPPSMTYWLGTDNFGRDLLTRILYGARISLVVGIVPSFISLAIGAVMGIISGYCGGRTDFVDHAPRRYDDRFSVAAFGDGGDVYAGGEPLQHLHCLEPRGLGGRCARGAFPDACGQGEGVHRGCSRQRHDAY